MWDLPPLALVTKVDLGGSHTSEQCACRQLEATQTCVCGLVQECLREQHIISRAHIATPGCCRTAAGAVHLHSKHASHQMHRNTMQVKTKLVLTAKLLLQETRELQAEKAELDAVGRRGSNVSEQPDVSPRYDSGDGRPAGSGEATSRQLLCAIGRQASALAMLGLQGCNLFVLWWGQRMH